MIRNAICQSKNSRSKNHQYQSSRLSEQDYSVSKASVIKSFQNRGSRAQSQRDSKDRS